MIERRFIRGAECRATGDESKPGLEGYAAVFNQEYVLFDSGSSRWIETIKPGSFSKVLRSTPDVRCLFNHEPDHVLARTTNSTLQLAQDSKGLSYTADLDSRTQIGKDVRCFVDRKDVTGCSFSFQVSKQTWREEQQDDGKMTIYTREIEEFGELFDVGPVTFPAYDGTSVAARGRELNQLQMPVEMRSRLMRELRDAQDGDPDPDEACRCRCRACYSADCDECDMHMQRCGDGEYCDHSAPASRSRRDSEAPTKRVDGEDLTSECFIYVGDPDKPETWALPWKFKTAAKMKSHLRNALARFNQTTKIPSDKKAAAWSKLVKLCKKYGIAVSDDESKSWNLSAEQRADFGLRNADANGDVLGCECKCRSCSDGNCKGCPDDLSMCGDSKNCACGRSAPLDQEQAKARAHALKLSLS